MWWPGHIVTVLTASSSTTAPLLAPLHLWEFHLRLKPVSPTIPGQLPRVGTGYELG